MKPAGTNFTKLEASNFHIDHIGKYGFADWMISRHYLKKWPAIVVCRLGLIRDNRIVGICIFALPPRETEKRYGGKTWELARLFLEDELPRNAESWFIARAVKHVRVSHREVRYLVSYADPSVGHTGAIYRAANWLRDGRTDDDRKSPRFDYRCVLTGKHFSRKTHIPIGLEIERVPRISKYRYYLAVK